MESGPCLQMLAGWLVNSAGDLEVGEFTTQQLWFQEALGLGVTRESRGPGGIMFTGHPGVQMMLIIADP